MALFSTKQWKILIIAAAAAVVLAMVVWEQSQQRVELQAPKSYTSGQAPQVFTSQPASKETPPIPPLSGGALAPTATSVFSLNEVNLAVPFAPQAPHANWDQPYQDACEEAALIMIDRYLRSASLSLEEMDAEILRMVDFQNEQFGFNKDSNIAETVRLAEAYFPHLSARAAYDITADDIRTVLEEGTPVAVLVDGRKLGNPYYTAPGPDKHALVIKGVVDGKFITNDPGTKRGADFVYKIETVMNALVDYDGNTPGTSKRAMIILTPAGS